MCERVNCLQVDMSGSDGRDDGDLADQEVLNLVPQG